MMFSVRVCRRDQDVKVTGQVSNLAGCVSRYARKIPVLHNLQVAVGDEGEVARGVVPSFVPPGEVNQRIAPASQDDRALLAGGVWTVFRGELHQIKVGHLLSIGCARNLHCLLPDRFHGDYAQQHDP
jgi:hypothetical protein